MERRINFAKAVNEALHQAMQNDASVICYGLGTDDPKGVFGTTLGLQEKFGPDRVFDMPTAENAMTGIAIGASLNGIRPVMTHQRLDFFLLAMDQLVNNAAKWHYMFGGKSSVPITIRLILGRGWGQGPTHSQNLQAWFTHIPGIKVVAPALAADAKGLLLASIADNDPVVFLEHRWLHNLEGHVPPEPVCAPLGKAQLIKKGDAVTIAAFSYMTVEALHAVDVLEKQGVHCDLLDLRTLSPLDWPAVFASVRRTGRLLALDTGNQTCSVASEIVARVSTECFSILKAPPRRLALPDFPTPTSPSLTKGFYVGAEEIAIEAGKLVGKDIVRTAFDDHRARPQDVPGDWFKGPF